MNKYLKENKKKVVLYGTFIMIMIFTVLGKCNLHVDEIYSFGLSNNIGTTDLIPENGVIYNPASTPFFDYVNVNIDERFNYQNVWLQQKNDTHPILYYVLLHTICSFFPGRFSIWFAAIINFVFAIFTLFILRKMVFVFIKDEFMQDLTSILFIFSCGILSMVSFLRMYVMSMFWVTLLSYLIVKLMDKNQPWKVYVWLFLTAVLGALTHYYCIVYLVFISISFGLFCLIKRRWRDIGYLIISTFCAMCASIAIFPAMLEHLFIGNRGKESIDNFANISMNNFWVRIKGYYGFINNQLFGGVLSYIIIFFLLVSVMTFLLERKNLLMVDEPHFTNNTHKELIVKWITVAIPILLYFLFISRTAVYVADRYIFPIFAIVLVEVMCGLYYGIKKLINCNRKKYICLCIIGTIMIVNNWRFATWPYLFTNTQTLLSKAKENENADCLILYDVTWKIQSTFIEASNYKSVMFIPLSSMDMLMNTEYIKSDNLMIILIGGDEKNLQTVMDYCPALDCYDKIGEYAYGTTYHLYGKQEHKKIISISNLEGSNSLYVGEGLHEDSCNAKLIEEERKIEYIYNEESGYGSIWLGDQVLDINGNVLETGTNVQWYPYNGTDAQKWKICENEDGTYMIYSIRENLVLAYGDEGNLYLGSKDMGDKTKWVIKF